MPWSYATPESTTTVYDALRVESFTVSGISSPRPRVLVDYDRGVYDSETGVFTVSEETQAVEIAEATVLALMASVPAGATLYDVIKAAIYSGLTADGVSPPGTLH